MSQFINLNNILENGKSYQVPIYQRDYSWDKEVWEDLWSDIEEIPFDKTHYLGYIVLQQINEDEDAYWIIDGQQRITTLSLLALAVTATLDTWIDKGIEIPENTIRREKITERYLGNYSLSKMHLLPKLKLNRNNDDFYQSWLLKLRTPASLTKLKPTQKLLQQALNYFIQKLDEKFSNHTSGADLSDFLEKTVGSGLLFTQIMVSNDLDAFKVFETLNARGVKLSTADLLKNYLFKLTHTLGEIDLNEAERRWQNITNTIQSNDLTTFIRHYWNSRYKMERQQSLFKALKREINSAEKAYHFLDELEKASIYYTAFHNPNDEEWDKEESVHLKVLSLLHVSTCFPLMLSAIFNIPRAEFKKVIKELSIITLRYNLSDLNPNEAERVFSTVANEISNKKINNAREIITGLKSIYVPDDNFEQNFSTIKINTRKRKELVKYLLIKIENQISETDHQAEDSHATIEHILPENPGSIWDASFPVEQQENYIYKFGNYSLLEASINHKLDNNMDFNSKLLKYKTSKYRLSNEYCNFHYFTPNELSLRQSRLAKVAKGIWKSAYL
jgi:uncharacterized protein with ParB-like and HNH nuclease domain